MERSRFTGEQIMLRDECLNKTFFMSLGHARRVLSDWREDYNTMRPHPQLDGRTSDKRLGEQEPNPHAAYPF